MSEKLFFQILGILGENGLENEGVTFLKNLGKLFFQILGEVR